MASTITRTTWTDDSGTPASPVGDGTTINNARLQDIYAAIDELFAGAAPYDPLVFGGTIQVDGLGTHLFSATGAGANRLRVRAASSGTGNVGAVDVGTDADADLGRLEAYASTFTETGAATQHGVALCGMGAGGVSLAAEHASGDMRLYARGTTKRATFDGETQVLSGGAVGAYGLIGIIQGSVDLGSDGTPATTTETTLKTWDLPAGALARDDQGIRMHAFGSFAANATDKTVRIKFGATTVLTYAVVIAGGGLGTGGGGWRAQVDLFRTGATAQKAIPWFVAAISNWTDADFMTTTGYTTPAETLSGAVTIELTGENGTGTADDIVCEGFYVEFLPGA